MIADLTPVVREALGVSSSYDDVTIPAGIRRAIAFLLRSWSFPAAVAKTSPALADGATQIVLPASGVGKIRAVRIRDAGSTEFKRLRRTLLGELPSSSGPTYYWQEGNLLKIDTPISGTGYVADVWYNSVDIDAAESWITADFEDICFTLSVMRLAVEMRKAEVAATFQQIWGEQVPTLAQYLHEVEFNDLDIRMRPDIDPVPTQRYGT